MLGTRFPFVTSLATLPNFIPTKTKGAIMGGETGVETVLQIWASREMSMVTAVAMGLEVAQASEVAAMEEATAVIVGPIATKW